MASIVTNTADETKDFLIDPDLVLEAELLLNAYGQEITESPGPFCLYEMKNYAVGRAILKADPELQATLFFLSLPLITRKDDPTLGSVHRELIGRTLPWNATQLERLLRMGNPSDSESLLRQVEDYQKRVGSLTPTMTAELHKMLAFLNQYPSARTRKIVPRTMKLLGEGRSVLPQAGEPWVDTALADIAVLPESELAVCRREAVTKICLAYPQRKIQVSGRKCPDSCGFRSVCALIGSAKCVCQAHTSVCA